MYICTILETGDKGGEHTQRERRCAIGFEPKEEGRIMDETRYIGKTFMTTGGITFTLDR